MHIFNKYVKNWTVPRRRLLVVPVHVGDVLGQPEVVVAVSLRERKGCVNLMVYANNKLSPCYVYKI